MSSVQKVISLERVSYSSPIDKHCIWEGKLRVSISTCFSPCGQFPHRYYDIGPDDQWYSNCDSKSLGWQCYFNYLLFKERIPNSFCYASYLSVLC